MDLVWIYDDLCHYVIQNDDIRWSKPFNKASSVFFSRRCFELRGDDIGHPLCIAGAGNLSMSNSSN